ncbi:MAG TPA: type IV pilus modification protein PilV [Methylophaga aminisulfidivorans]|uniref:Type IV pilus modification protein PilV n=2 Tax=root TaxID=1 RepID=A0A7C1W443_9GAMM|nr:type IV pilus modification protein PilV [Methylophaga aminisulfidivorans]
MNHHKQTGFTLLEVMVAVFVLAIGLLGMAHLQVTTLKSNQSADLKTQASILASDILERMRSNSQAAFNQNYDITMNTATPGGNGTLHITDIIQWRNELNAQLPAGNGSINCPAFVINQEFMCTITVQWSDIQLGDANVDYNDYSTSSMVIEGAL